MLTLSFINNNIYDIHHLLQRLLGYLTLIVPNALVFLRQLLHKG